MRARCPKCGRIECVNHRTNKKPRYKCYKCRITFPGGLI
jgi:hypothetical protein